MGNAKGHFKPVEFSRWPPTPVSQRIPDPRVGPQRAVRSVVLLARGAGERHRHRDVVAFARGSLAQGRIEHVQAQPAQDLRHALAQVGVGFAHRGDFEAAGKLEALAFLRREVVEVAHRHCVFGVPTGVGAPTDVAPVGTAVVVLPVPPWWNHNRIASHNRLKKPPCGSSCNATRGASSTGFPSSVTCSAPTLWPCLKGAIRRAGMSSVAFSSEYLPRGIVITASWVNPSGKELLAPFHNRGVASGFPAANRSCVS